MDPVQVLLKAAIFEGLDESDVEPLRPALRARTFDRGAYLFREGDPGSHLYIVVRGQVKIGRISEGGQEVVFAIAGPDELFGEMSLFEEHGQRSADAQALERTECLLIARDALLAFLHSRPNLLLRIISTLCAHIRRKDEAMIDIAYVDVPGRVGIKLVELAEGQGDDEAGGTVIDLPIKQRTLAGMVGASREQVNRALRTFANLGYIRIEEGTITVLNREQLRRRGSRQT